MVYTTQKLNKWKDKVPLLASIMSLNPVLWLNHNKKQLDNLPELSITKSDIEEAEKLMQRFAPFIAIAFPETAKSDGIIESPLKEIKNAQQELEKKYFSFSGGKLYMKCDNDLPIAGSIKARGGIYEVLHLAENLALEAGLLSSDENYEAFASEKFKAFFKQFKIGVGSTGNLGLSIGIISAKLGFSVSVYMSSDAKQWKKDLLRSIGANVHEFSGDFSEAITAGREKTISEPNGYFVDDENSKNLYLGYSVAAGYLHKQITEQKIQVDAEHPLFVYIPCGVGGAPGGVSFGLKQQFGDHVHCFFVEPTHSPSVLIGLLTGEMNNVSVQDFGLDNKTDADGLAVGRPSKFATPISNHLISGIYTIEDDELYKLLVIIAEKEGINLEPSAAAGLLGPNTVLQSRYLEQNNLKAENITHIVWATGGALVPERDFKMFYEKGKQLNK